MIQNFREVVKKADQECRCLGKLHNPLHFLSQFFFQFGSAGHLSVNNKDFHVSSPGDITSLSSAIIPGTMLIRLALAYADKLMKFGT